MNRFGRNADGLAAVEFAIILPIMITMVFGMGEISRLLNCRAGISQLTGTVGDLVAQASAPNNADINNVYRAANTILYPYYNPASTAEASAQRPTIRITSIIFDTAETNATTAKKIGKVAWSCKQAGSGALSTPNRAVNSKVTLNQELLATGSSVLMVEVVYKYTSPTSEAVTGSYTMQDSFITKPRRVGQIPSPGCTA